MSTYHTFTVRQVLIAGELIQLAVGGPHHQSYNELTTLSTYHTFTVRQVLIARELIQLAVGSPHHQSYNELTSV